LVATALKGYDKGIKNLTSCLETEKVIAVEEPLDKWNARADLITERGSDFIVTDHKVRYKYDARYAPSNQLESEVSWQLWDYAYRVSLKYDRPVTHIRTHFVYLTPSPKSVLHEKAITEQAIENWHLGAEVKWAEWHKLHRGLLIEQPMITINCHNRYGKCEFYDFCWLAEKDEQRAAMLYNKKGGKSGMDSQNNQMP